MNNKCSFWRKSHKIGLFLSILFSICYAWMFINPVETELHMQLFKMSYLWFDAANAQSFFAALLQTYIWGYIVVLAWKITGYCPFLNKK